jgi:hypothetical protein
MTSKPKFGFKGLTAVTNRTTQKVKEKVGKAEETVDVGFNQEHAKFDLYYKQLKKMSKDLSDYTKSLRGTCFFPICAHLRMYSLTSHHFALCSHF